MGFMNVVGRMMRGEQAFQDEDSAKAKPQPTDQSPTPPPDTSAEATIRKHDASSYPKVELDRRLIVKESGGSLSVHGLIKNSWPEEAWIEEVGIFGKRHRMSESLHGHEDDELELYSGAVLTKQYPEATLRYWVLNKVTKKKDYFQGVYRITYTYDPKTNTQIPNEAYLIRVDDIFG